MYRKIIGDGEDVTDWISCDRIKIATLPVMVMSKWCKLCDRTK